MEAGKRYRYTGMERDEESGLSYHTARYYVPWLGRWTSSDPLGTKDGVNLYQYVGSHPIRLKDSRGTQSTQARDNWSWRAVKEDSAIAALISARRIGALFNPAYFFGLTKVGTDQEFDRESLAALMAAQAGDFDKALEIAGGEYMKIHLEGQKAGASLGEQGAVAVGQATGFNQAIETIGGETRSGESLTGFSRVATGVDAALRLASTVALSTGVIRSGKKLSFDAVELVQKSAKMASLERHLSQIVVKKNTAVDDLLLRKIRQGQGQGLGKDGQISIAIDLELELGADDALSALRAALKNNPDLRGQLPTDLSKKLKQLERAEKALENTIELGQRLTKRVVSPPSVPNK